MTEGGKVFLFESLSLYPAFDGTDECVGMVEKKSSLIAWRIGTDLCCSEPWASLFLHRTSEFVV